MIYINAVHGLSVYRFNRGRGPRFDGISLRGDASPPNRTEGTDAHISLSRGFGSTDRFGLRLLLSLNRGKEAYELREPM